jgi:hypothetical protein
MSEIPQRPKSVSPDDALPPVEPPSAGFLVQLFLIPGLIVAIIVVVWLLFHWLAQMGNDPREYVKKLRGNNEVRWQAAVNLAGALHGAAGDEIKRDTAVANDLGDILKEEIATGSMDERPINLRIYLCRALGEFKVEAALPALLIAATTQRGDAELDVRRAAIYGLASLAANLKKEQPGWKNADLLTTLIAASKSENDNLRAESAFALGLIADEPEVAARLEQMLDDPHPDARFIVEMLGSDQTQAAQEERPENKQQKQAIVNINGLRAIAQLADANSEVDLHGVEAPVQQLTESKIPEMRDEAIAVREKLLRRKTTTGSK